MSVNGNIQQSVGSQKSRAERHLLEQGHFFPGKENTKIAMQEKRYKGFYCSYCKVGFSAEEELKSHCSTESHQLAITTDDDKKWRYRPPPRGQKRKQLNMCHELKSKGTCRLADQCFSAHSESELAEWQERMAYREWKLEQAKQEDLNGSSYAEQLLERWMKATNPETVIAESCEGAIVEYEPKLFATFSAKNSTQSWTFSVKAKFPLRVICLLYDSHRPYFRLLSLSADDKNVKIEPGSQEWYNPHFNSQQASLQHQGSERQFAYILKMKFDTDIFGTFRQTLALDFGRDPVLEQKLCVDVVPPADLAQLQEVRETVLCVTERWNSSNSLCIPFENKAQTLNEQDLRLLHCYPIPNPVNFVVTQAISSSLPLESTYKSRFHELLYIEEMAQYNLIARFNVSSKLQLVESYILAPGTTSIMKYAQKGELYACMKLSSEVSEDLPAGRMIQTNCSSVFLAPIVPLSKRNTENNSGRRKVFEAVIEDKGKKMIYLRLPKQCVSEFNLKPDREYIAEVQFQLNRMPFCEMHYSIDGLDPVGLVFPDTDQHIEIPPANPEDPPWDKSLDEQLNPKQKEAITAITAPLDIHLPPILIIGPFGTGKTFTLAQAVKGILKSPENRVLVCTHSNSAADIYIREYLHPFVEQGHPEARPVRVYYQHRWVATVHQTVLQYCLVDKDSATTFRLPTVEDLEKHKVVVTTLSSSRYLVNLNLSKTFFTHILIDEAAQAMESEAIMPLALADVGTRIALAGDHMQLSPEVYSPFAQEKNMQLSLLERLFDLYKAGFPCKILLCENYRSHKAIVQYTSDMFYQNSLLASKSQPPHKTFFPLTFFTARGEDVQDTNSTAYYNNSEVYEVAERVLEIHKSWPTEWGPVNDSSIGVVTPYYDQVVRIRTELRKRKLPHVSVERVLNVQGKQFRAIVLSTVRTLQTCSGGKGPNGEELDYGFLSNARLLNTAITRGQSLVAVVGDPVSLCSMGKCRKLWERFIRICYENDSLHGISWQTLQTQLDGLELKKTYMLNPLAPEFIPRRMRHGKMWVSVSGSGSSFYGTPPPPSYPPIMPYPYPTNMSNSSSVQSQDSTLGGMYPLGPFPDPYSLTYPFMGMPFPPPPHPPHHFLPVPYSGPPYGYPWFMANKNPGSSGGANNVVPPISSSTGMHLSMSGNSREPFRSLNGRQESKLKGHEGFLNESSTSMSNNNLNRGGSLGNSMTNNYQSQNDRGSMFSSSSTEDSGFDEMDRPFQSRLLNERYRMEKNRMMDPVEFAINSSQMCRMDRNRNLKNEVALTLEQQQQQQQQRQRFSMMETFHQQQSQQRRNSFEGMNNQSMGSMMSRPSPDLEESHHSNQLMNHYSNGIPQDRFISQEDFSFQNSHQQPNHIQQHPFQAQRLFNLDGFHGKGLSNIENSGMVNNSGPYNRPPPDLMGPFGDRGCPPRFNMGGEPNIDMSDNFPRRRSLPSSHAITVEQLEAMLLAGGGMSNNHEGMMPPGGMIMPDRVRQLPMKLREENNGFPVQPIIHNSPEMFNGISQRQFEDSYAERLSNNLSQMSMGGSSNSKHNHSSSPQNHTNQQSGINHIIEHPANIIASDMEKNNHLPISSSTSSQDLCSYEKLLQVSARVWSEPLCPQRPTVMTNQQQSIAVPQSQMNMFAKALTENEIFERPHLEKQSMNQFGNFSIGPIGPMPPNAMSHQLQQMDKGFRNNHMPPVGPNLYNNHPYLSNTLSGMTNGPNMPPNESRLLGHLMNGFHNNGPSNPMMMQNGIDKSDMGMRNEDGGGYNVFQHKTILASDAAENNKPAGLYHVF